MRLFSWKDAPPKPVTKPVEEAPEWSLPDGAFLVDVQELLASHGHHLVVRPEKIVVYLKLFTQPPPIWVSKDKKRLLDGNHRLLVACMRGESQIRAEFRP